MDRKCEWCGRKIPDGEEFYSNEWDGRRYGVYHSRKCQVEAANAGIQGNEVAPRGGSSLGTVIFWSAVVVLSFAWCSA